MKKIFFLLLVLFLFFPSFAQARIGVGIGTGKIDVSDILKPGIIYQLPSVAVLNTGDEPSDYEVTISALRDQKEIFPDVKWFVFTPQRFRLEPGKVQKVDITINLPIKTPPGKYFAFLEGHPVKVADNSGVTQVNVAAAARLYFTVAPANLVLGAYYKAISYWKIYAPWPKIITVVLALFFIIVLFKKFFKIQLSVKKPPVKKDE